MAPKLPVSPGAVASAFKELRDPARRERPLVVAGPQELVGVLKRELVRGGVAEAVREQGPLERAAGLLYVHTGEADEEARRVLREAERSRLPAVCVVAGPRGGEIPDPPGVLAENVVRLRSGEGFPVEEIARALARAMGEKATPLAARLPVLRRPVCEELIRRASRQNGVIGVVVFVPGADMPVLTLNQIRLVLRIADAHGFEIDRERLPEVLAVIGGGLGFRGIARSALGLVPLAGWAVKGGIAYTGTRALGEAALRYFERRAPVTRVPGGRAKL